MKQVMKIDEVWNSVWLFENLRVVEGHSKTSNPDSVSSLRSG
jgi:hypothetical protein